MDLERAAVSGRSWSAAACSSSSSSSGLSSSSAADPMVRIELEAAEALADLAHFTVREVNGVPSNGKWGCKGQRAKKRAKTESPLSDSPFHPVDAFTLPTHHLAPDETEVDQQFGEPLDENLVLNQVQLETDANIPKTRPRCGRTYPSYGGGRSGQNLTQVEKEERRLYRILANRESARQTIRCRQALCEELARKAADLAWENQNLKKERESALKEFQSLETINQQLKAQMAEVIKPEVEESLGNIESASGEMPSSLATNCPVLLYNCHPFSSHFWPSIVRSSYCVQAHHMPQNEPVISCAGMPPNEISSPLMPCSVKNDVGLQSGHTPISAGVFAKTSQLISALKENTQDGFKFHSKEPVDATAAAEARRRRKELTKLKNLHGRQCRMNC